MEIGKTYRLNNNDSIAEEYRNKEFILKKKDGERVYIRLEGEDRLKNFKIEKWDDYVVNDYPPWQGNKLLFKFI